MMEVLRAMLACILGRRRSDEYAEVIYDEKMALYSDNEPYSTQHDAMTYDSGHPLIYDEKTAPYPGNELYNTQHDAMTYHSDHPYPEETAGYAFDPRTVEEIARELARLLWRAEWNDDALQARISETVGERRWNRRMVEECLHGVIGYVERGRARMGDAMCEALDKVTDIADEEFVFPRRHPQSLDGFIAIVSVGVLAELQGAWVLELLGFGEVQDKEELDDGSGEIAMLTSDKIVFSPRPKTGSMAAWWAREYDAYIPSGSVYSYLRRLEMVEPED